MVDAYASYPHLVDHLAPVWRALPEDARGVFVVPHRWLVKAAAARGVDATFGEVHGDGPPVLIANRHDLTQCPRRAGIFVEHGAGQTYATFPNHPSYSGGSQRERVGLFLTLNETTAARERARYPHACVEVVGSPRLDDLALVARRPADRSPHLPAARRPVVVFAWHWPLALVPETRETFTHWRGAIRDLARSGEWEVLGHGHPRWFEKLRVLYEMLGIEPVQDFAEVVARADVLAFDNSSVAYEAAALGIPVLALNHPRYRRDVSHGLRFWDQIPGPQWDDPATLADGLRLALRSEWWGVRAEIVPKVYPPATRGRAAQLAANAIMGWSRSRV